MKFLPSQSLTATRRAAHTSRHLRVSRPLAVVCLWAFALLAGAAVCARATAQIVPTPTTEAPATTANTAPATTAPSATTRPTVARTAPRRSSTTRGPSTTPPTTTPTTVAGTLPPTTAGPTPATATIPIEDTRPGEGKMPAWPMVASGVGLAGAAGILGRQWVHTRPR